MGLWGVDARVGNIRVTDIQSSIPRSGSETLTQQKTTITGNTRTKQHISAKKWTPDDGQRVLGGKVVSIITSAKIRKIYK